MALEHAAFAKSSQPVAKRAKVEVEEQNDTSEVIYPSMTYVVRSMCGTTLTAGVCDVRSPAKNLRHEVAVATSCAPFSFHLIFGEVTLMDDETLEAQGVDQATGKPIHIVMIMLVAKTSVGGFERFYATQLRVDNQDQCSVLTKIGNGDFTPYFAVAKHPMEPNTGIWWWSYRIRTNVFDPEPPSMWSGVCLADVDVIEDDFCLSENAATYGGMSGRFPKRMSPSFSDVGHYDLPVDRHQTHWPDCGANDVVTFSLNTHFGVLTMYRNGAKLGILSDKLKGLTLYAHIGLMDEDDSVELFNETKPIVD